MANPCRNGNIIGTRTIACQQGQTVTVNQPEYKVVNCFFFPVKLAAQQKHVESSNSSSQNPPELFHAHPNEIKAQHKCEFWQGILGGKLIRVGVQGS